MPRRGRQRLGDRLKMKQEQPIYPLAKDFWGTRCSGDGAHVGALPLRRGHRACRVLVRVLTSAPVFQAQVQTPALAACPARGRNPRIW